MDDIEELLRLATKRNASDIHIQVGLPPVLRVLTRLVPLDSEKLSTEAIESLIFSIMSDEQKEIFQNRLQFDFSYSLPGVGRFRINVFMESSLRALCDRGVITEEDALEHAFDAREMARLLGRRRL